jgi:uncharacterized protein YndB with AHSA1/START domain
MPTYQASRELLARPSDVWRFVAEPGHLADWWPGIAGVEPDRRGLTAGARWLVRSGGATYFRKAGAEDTLVVTAVDPEWRFAFELVKAKVRVDLTLSPAPRRRTEARLTVEAPWLGFSRRLPGDALARLHDLCQTAGDL